LIALSKGETTFAYNGTIITDDMGKMKNAYEILIGKLESKTTTSEALTNGKLIILKEVLQKYNMRMRVD
jgi:hypothetical protein